MVAAMLSFWRSYWFCSDSSVSSRPSWRILIEPSSPRICSVASFTFSPRPNGPEKMRATSAGLSRRAASSFSVSVLSEPVLGSVVMPSWLSVRRVPSPVATRSAAAMADWMLRVVPSPVRALCFSALTSNAVRSAMVVCRPL
ncbi:Uncharacterised protein [Bordetella pertussis]|nr:Uncharacterised protein [Bordetella pertussis]